MESKKKVLVFIPEFPVLTETFIERELTKLVQRDNVDVVVFSIRKGIGEVSDILRSKVSCQRLSIFDVVRAKLYLILHLAKVKELFELLKNYDKDFFSKYYLIIKAFGYAKKFSKFKPDFILAHFLSAPSTLVMLVSNILNIPYGVSAHARDVTVEAELIDDKLETSRFITICNRSAYKFLLGKVRDGKTDKIKLSYHGINAEELIRNAKEEVNLKKPDIPLILSIGRLVEKKGLLYLIEAAKILKDRGMSVLVYVIGKGPLYGSLQKVIKDLSLENEVKILGNNAGLPNKEVLSYLKISDVFAFPSIQTNDGDADGIANVLLEAGVFGIPVVATNSGSTIEVIVNENTGLICEQKNSESLASCIERLLKDVELSKKVREGLNTKVLNEFDIDKRILDLESLLIANY